MPRSKSRGAFVALGATLAAGFAAGSITDPTLALSAAQADAGAQSRAVHLEGVFPAEALVQSAFPLQVLIREVGPGSAYVRYDLAGSAVTGVAPELADGLDAAEAASLLTQGTPSSEARVLFLGAARIELALPSSLPSGTAEAQLFVMDEGVPILSNPLVFAISEPTQ